MKTIFRKFHQIHTIPRYSFMASNSTPYKIAVFSSKKYDQEYFTKSLEALPESKLLSLDFFPEQLNHKTAKLASGHNTVCSFVNDKINAECVTALKEIGVDLITLRCAGFNHVDLKKCKSEGITVVRVPAYSPYAVAEYTMALLLTLNRKINKAYNRTREGNFSLDGLMGFDMHQKKVGILGAGKIGRVFAKICSGFEMNISYYDIEANEEMQQLGAKRVELDTLLKESDIVSLHCPLNHNTEHIINKDTLAKMKPSAVLVNTGRGALIHTEAVLNALKEKKLAGLAIDVYEGEEKIFFRDKSGEVFTDDDLMRLLMYPNVIVTGHQAFFTEEAVKKITATTLQNVLEFRKTGKSQNEVKA